MQVSNPVEDLVSKKASDGDGHSNGALSTGWASMEGSGATILGGIENRSLGFVLGAYYDILEQPYTQLSSTGTSTVLSS
jgi:hypothetical protein